MPGGKSEQAQSLFSGATVELPEVYSRGRLDKNAAASLKISDLPSNIQANTSVVHSRWLIVRKLSGSSAGLQQYS
jgi:hypothetical protein